MCFVCEIPAGVYELIPYYKGENTVFDVSPPILSLSVQHDHAAISQKFQVYYIGCFFDEIECFSLITIYVSELSIVLLVLYGLLNGQYVKIPQLNYGTLSHLILCRSLDFLWGVVLLMEMA